MAEQDPVEVAAHLAESFDGFTGQLSRLHRSGTRNRVVMVVLAVVIVALGWVAWQQRQAQAQLHATQAQLQQVQGASHASQLRACRLANGDRARDAAVWKVILKVPANARPATRRELAVLVALVRKKDALRDCAALYATNR
jgi:uncharacterized protein HemX